jgi:hypothetical protein
MQSTTETPSFSENQSAAPSASASASPGHEYTLENLKARLARLSGLTQTQSQSQPEQPSKPRSSKRSLGRHTRKCAVCNHPDREQIEDDFLRWHDPWDIADAYDLPSRSSLYRHAEALGLLAQRRRNLRGVAERFLERVDDATFTSNSILQAMRLFAHITEDGQWIEPAKRAIVTHIHTYSGPGCHSEPSRPPLANGGDEFVVAGLSRQSCASVERGATPPPGNAPCDEPVGAASHHPPSSCHSERGCDEHPTRNLQFAPQTSTREQVVAEQLHSRMDEQESLPIARSTRAKSSAVSSHSPLATSHSDSSIRHSSFDTRRRAARERDNSKRATILDNALELLPGVSRIVAAAEARASDSVVGALIGPDQTAPGDAMPASAVSRHLLALSEVEGSLGTRHCISNRDNNAQSRSGK